MGHDHDPTPTEVQPADPVVEPVPVVEPAPVPEGDAAPTPEFLMERLQVRLLNCIENGPPNDLEILTRAYKILHEAC